MTASRSAPALLGSPTPRGRAHHGDWRELTCGPAGPGNWAWRVENVEAKAGHSTTWYPPKLGRYGIGALRRAERAGNSKDARWSRLISQQLAAGADDAAVDERDHKLAQAVTIG